MRTVENTITRTLPETQTPRIFESCYMSQFFVLITTTKCPQKVFKGLVSLLELNGLDSFSSLNTFTSRELLLGRLSKLDESLPDVILKKSRFRNSSHNSLSFQPGSVANEIKGNLLLDTVVQKLMQSGELCPSNGFRSLAVRVEKPLGILVDKRNKSKYSIFSFEGGFDLGEILQYTDPPIQGAVNYNPQDWKIFCGIKDVLDRIVQAASQEGLTMQDYDAHQILYRADGDTRSLKLILIDSERFRIKNKR